MRLRLDFRQAIGRSLGRNLRLGVSVVRLRQYRLPVGFIGGCELSCIIRFVFEEKVFLFS